MKHIRGINILSVMALAMAGVDDAPPMPSDPPRRRDPDPPRPPEPPLPPPSGNWYRPPSGFRQLATLPTAPEPRTLTRDEIAAQEKRERRAAKARRDGERRAAGKRPRAPFAPVWVESNGLWWISVAERDDANQHARVAEIETKEEPYFQDDSGDDVTHEIFIYNGEPGAESALQILGATSLDAAKRRAEEAVVEWGLEWRCA